MQQILDGRYELLKPLGSGGFGKTYLAQDLRIPGHPRCVVKQLHCHSQNPKDIQLAQQLFQREAESLANLGHHDQIPRLLAYFNENEEFYLVEDYIEGTSLDQEIRNGQPWSEEAVMALVESLLEILTFVHSQKVIHRDIKPENLIRRRQDGRIVLIDFGAIKRLEHTAIQGFNTGTQIGTIGYMPPEQAQGKPRPNSDIYGVGMVAIAALTGHPAMGLPDDPQTGEIIWRPLAPQVSPSFGQILDKMVKYHFQRRYQTAQEVLQDLRGLSANAPIQEISSQRTAIANTQTNSPSPKTRGKPWLFGLTLAILIPMVGGAAAFLLSPLNRALAPTTENPDPPISSPEICKAIVNGNIRSERTAYFGSGNILRSGQGQAFDVGNKETRGGWIEIRLPSGQTAWTHLDVVSNETALKECLRTQDIQLTAISDILPPPTPSPSPSPSATPSATPSASPTLSPEVNPEDSPTESANETLPPEAPEEETPISAPEAEVPNSEVSPQPLPAEEEPSAPESAAETEINPT